MRKVRFYNTLSRKKEVFKPVEEGKVKIYVCGITSYDYAHLGHARSYVFFDFVRRLFEHLGYSVVYVQNFTDVDDKIIERAKELGVSEEELAEKFILEYFKDADALGIRRASHYPRVTEHIGDIVDFIKKLIEKGYAYKANGNVYFSVKKFKGYGKLSKQNINEMLAGARVEAGEGKRNELDFALWKKAKQGEIAWETELGKGRPGWHIECSTMAMKYLGESIDIHGGGMDLIFPHHENEIAQSEALTGKPFARYFIHHALITVRGEKMSKSLGNFITIRELLEKYDKNVIRYFLLFSHYRKPLDYSDEALENAKAALERIRNAVSEIKEAMQSAEKLNGSELREKIERSREAFFNAICDDFNTPQAISELFNFIREVNKYISEKKERAGYSELYEALNFIREAGSILGIDFEEEKGIKEEELVKILAEVREMLRENKNYELADYIRERLRKAGIILEDTEKGTKIRIRE